MFIFVCMCSFLCVFMCVDFPFSFPHVFSCLRLSNNVGSQGFGFYNKLDSGFTEIVFVQKVSPVSYMCELSL